MAFDYRRYEFKRDSVLVDPRNHFAKFTDKVRKPHTSVTIFVMSALLTYAFPLSADLLLFYNAFLFYYLVFAKRKEEMPFRMPKTSGRIDPGYKAPGTNRARQADGILYLGNEERTSEEVWFTNTDARTHILYLGTTGSGKTEGLKSLASNALGWGSGFIYVDGKADTDLWGSISGLARRFGRDDDLLVLNYMTGNSDARIASNTINPFSKGSASYLTNMLVSLMPEVQGDNAMWKDRAVSLIAALMPVLTWQRNFQEKPLNITVIREALNLKRVIEYSRRPEIPVRHRQGLRGYLETLPGYTDAGFNDDGTERPNPSGPPLDYSTIYQQHGYLAMQFTRQLQSLADDYGYIFEAEFADIDMMDVVLNRRILVVLIPALEKSADETANLGKIVGSMLKGMMGATLGSSVEGDTDIALENKPTRSSTPFMAIFDEVGYYTTQGMAVMAAQARSLGFSLVFAGQDLPALEKRVKEEARSITANCNIKIFGKLEDPTQTKEFFEKTVGEAAVIESSTRKEVKVMFNQKRLDKTDNFNVTTRAKASYGQLKDFKEGQAIICFGNTVVQTRMFFSDVPKVKSLRVNRFIPIAHPDPEGKLASNDIDAILERVRSKKWTAANESKNKLDDGIAAFAKYFEEARKQKLSLPQAGAMAITRHAIDLGKVQPGVSIGAAKSEPVKAASPKAAPVKAPDLKAEDKSLSPSAATTSVKTVLPPLADQKDAPEKTATEETISWNSIVGDSAAQKAPSTQPAKVSEKIPDTTETISWKDLAADNATPSHPASVEPQKPLAGYGAAGAGFGYSGYGTGFGGISGLGGGIPQPAKPSVETKKPESKSEAPAKDVDKPSDNGDTINWKDLVD